MAGPVTRFAPSPTGPLHLGHAYAAIVAHDAAQSGGGRFLLRIEDLDQARCKPEWVTGIYEDLQWLGLKWAHPVLHQQARRGVYDEALAHLYRLGLTYHCTCTRGDIKAALQAPQEGVAGLGPDGPVYPGTCRSAAHDTGAIRLNMAAAMAKVGPISFVETGTRPGVHHLDSQQMVTLVGDVVLARRDEGAAYHLAVVVDDAAQGVTLVTRGEDLFEATAIHVLLQRLLNLSSPTYHHHRLIRDAAGKRLAKRDDARALSRYRAEGVTPAQIRAMLGLALPPHS